MTLINTTMHALSGFCRLHACISAAFGLCLASVLVHAAGSTVSSDEFERLIQERMADATSLEDARLKLKALLAEHPLVPGGDRKELEDAIRTPVTFSNAMAAAVSKNQSLTCANNMRIIGAAFKSWAADHDDQFPFQISTAQGGSREMRKPGIAGYDANAIAHFRIIAGELNSPGIFRCPADTNKTASASFSRLAAGNVTYELRTSQTANWEDSGETLLRCSVHGHELECGLGLRRGTNAAPVVIQFKERP